MIYHIGKNSVPSVLKGIIESIYVAMTTGDLDNVRDTLKNAEHQTRELLPKIRSKTSREIIMEEIIEVNKLIEKLATKEANLDDVRTYITDAKEKLKQQLAEHSQEM